MQGQWLEQCNGHEDTMRLLVICMPREMAYINILYVYMYQMCLLVGVLVVLSPAAE